MARPFSKGGLDYIQIDIDILNDPKIFELEAIYPQTGFAFYIKALLLVYAESYCEVASPRLVRMLAKQCSITVDLCQKMLESCVEVDLFDEDLYKSYQLLTSRSMQHRYLRIHERKKHIVIIKAFSLIDPNKVKHQDAYFLHVDDPAKLIVKGQVRGDFHSIESAKEEKIVPRKGKVEDATPEDPAPPLRKGMGGYEDRPATPVKIIFDWDKEKETLRNNQEWKESFVSATRNIALVEKEIEEYFRWCVQNGDKKVAKEMQKHFARWIDNPYRNNKKPDSSAVGDQDYRTQENW